MPKKGTWSPAENFIRSGIGGSYTKALKVSTFHYNALKAQQADPRVKTMFLSYTLFQDNLVNASSKKGGTIGDRMADTRTKDELFDELNKTVMPETQQLIGNVYRRGTTKWNAIFPFGVSQIQNGPIENKLSALKTIHDKVHADLALAAADAILGPFYTLIVNARSEQLGEKSLVETVTSSQQDAMEAMSINQFTNYGTIVSISPNDSNAIKSFFDWQTLQQKEHSPLYENTVNKNRVKMAMNHLFTPISTLKVTCTVDLTVWVNDSVNNPSHPAGILVPANAPTVVGFPALGNPANRVLQVQNMSLTEKGHYAIEIL